MFDSVLSTLLSTVLLLVDTELNASTPVDALQDTPDIIGISNIKFQVISLIRERRKTLHLILYTLRVGNGTNAGRGDQSQTYTKIYLSLIHI